VIVDLLFAALNLIPRGERPVSPIEHATLSWNYTTWLDFAAIALAIWLWGLKMRQGRNA
jgi:hypothetical protein